MTGAPPAALRRHGRRGSAANGGTGAVPEPARPGHAGADAPRPAAHRGTGREGR